MSGLRVIGGRARGKRLKPVPGEGTRPITDRTKESLFNLIGPDLQDTAFLDLFAGTGAVGIEALSRGASFARFIDIAHLATDTVRANLAATGFAAQAEVLRMDSFHHLERPADRRFEYVYIAPPQYKSLWKRALLAVDGRPDWLAGDAWVIVQINPLEWEDPGPLQHLSEFDRRTYGSTLLIFYERIEEET